tara:strand:- start:17 stop:889 length:873 start_codon:yes stop_codon:yes gene_type:complete
MGFFDDLAMGFGAKPKTQDFKQRTAATIAKNKGGGAAGEAAAKKYLSDVGGSGLSFGNTPVGNLSNSGGQFQQPAPASSAGGYTSFSDRFDGGGPGMAGAQFGNVDSSFLDLNGDGYISEMEYNAGGNAALATQGGISSLSNKLGFRPLGSYEQERRLKSEGTNIGTSGIGDFLASGGMMGSFLNSGPTALQLANPNMPQGATLDPGAVSVYDARAEMAEPSLMEKLRLTPEFANPTPINVTDNSRDNNSLTVVEPPKPEEPVVVSRQPAIHIAPTRQYAYGGIVSLGRR